MVCKPVWLGRAHPSMGHLMGSSESMLRVPPAWQLQIHQRFGHEWHFKGPLPREELACTIPPEPVSFSILTPNGEK